MNTRLRLELTSALTLEMLGKPFLLEKRIVLLKAIQTHGSISKAAKAVPMAYKSAWEAVDVMNSLSPEPIVRRETGGKDGGGTTITAYGETLLKNYALLKEEHSRFLERLSDLTDIQSGTFKTIGRLAMQLSARNQIQVEVLELTSGKLNAKVLLGLKSGQKLLAQVTQEAVENMHLACGQRITAIFKSSTVLLFSRKEETMENCIAAVLRKCERDGQHCKVQVDIGSHDHLVSVLSCEDFDALGVEEGEEVYVSIQSKDIMLGK